ncbi:MAG: type IV secretion system DNA-binding domain-containing protein, partial [Oligoflexia bacterium]|nr:type IV secretion system DNA-binding domain-containing protein [Oligoflexia bacterium]
ERRIFFFLDEFGTLQRLNNILNMLKLSRSYGGSVWIGIQDMGQIENIYGRESTKTIMNSCGNTIIFGVDELLTAEYLSKKIGDRERSNIDKNFSFGLSEYRDGHSMSERTMVEKTILPSDIMGLEDLSFYFKLATLREFTKSKLEYKKYPATTQSFIEKFHSITIIPKEININENNDLVP